MKLRNKKTGEIVEYDSIGFRKGKSNGWDDFIPNADSLAALNEVWEDYKPAEPLIKDEKIRKAVRVWAEALGANKVSYMSGIYSFWSGSTCIEFDRPPIEPNLDKTYTITELCGEEEE